MSDETAAVKPQNAVELAQRIEAMANFEHDGGAGGYQASADALWKAAALAFNYVADRCGVTGFQASWAALKFYSEVMHVTCPFAIFKAEDAVFPQYDLPGRLQGYLDGEWREWIAAEAAKRLADYEERPTFTYTNDDGEEVIASTAHPDVVAHWRRLAAAGVGS